MPKRIPLLADGRLSASEQDSLNRANEKAQRELARKGGKSIIEELWEELDSIVSELMTDWANYTPMPRLTRQEHREAFEKWTDLRGQARGVAYCIAVFTQPAGHRSVDDVRAEAVRRFQEDRPPRSRRRAAKRS